MDENAIQLKEEEIEKLVLYLFKNCIDKGENERALSIVRNMIKKVNYVNYHKRKLM